VEVRGHDFKDKQLGHAIPYGIYDLTAEEGWVSIGITSDTAQFAVNTIISWWEHLGRERYPHARTLTITADSGGSNNPRTRLWRHELQRLADTTGLSVRVCHFRPHIEVEQDRAPTVQLRQPQLARQATGEPRSRRQPDRLHHDQHRPEGLRQLDDRSYERGIEITDDQLAAVNITRDTFHGDWNYTITPSLAQS